MVSQTPQTAEKQPNGRQGNGTPGHAKAGKVASAQPSKDGHAQRAAQDVAGLKDYVCILPRKSLVVVAVCRLMEGNSNWETAWAKELSGRYTGL